VTASTEKARRILVVDDEALVCDSIRRILALDQHFVEVAGTAQDALAAFQPGKFDLVILDYEMPSIKGDKLAAAIKAQDPHQPVMMITAFAETLRLAGTFPLAVDLVLNKPFDLQEFRDAVRHLKPR